MREKFTSPGFPERSDRRKFRIPNPTQCKVIPRLRLAKQPGVLSNGEVEGGPMRPLDETRSTGTHVAPIIRLGQRRQLVLTARDIHNKEKIE